MAESARAMKRQQMGQTGGEVIAQAALQMNLDPIFAELERQRRMTLRQYWSTVLKCLLLLPAVALPLALCVVITQEHSLLPAVEEQRLALRLRLQHDMGMAVVISVGLLLVGFALIGRYFNRNAVRAKWRYIADYKSQLYSRVCDQHFPGLKYVPGKGYSWKAFEASGLFRHAVDWYESEDYFEGRIGDTDVFFCEAHAKRERKNWGGNQGSNTYLDTFFQGLVFVADFHKHFHSTTRIVPSDAKIPSILGERRVAFEDPEFNERFRTTSTDQTDVRYVLSTSMLQRLLTLAKRFPKMRIRFHQEQLMLMLPTNREMFEPSLYSRASSSHQLSSFVRDVRLVWPIVEELNLNTRLWSKR